MVEKEKFDVEKKVVTVTDRFRTVEKLLLCENLPDFLLQGNGSQSAKVIFQDLTLLIKSQKEIFCKKKNK